MGYFDLQVNGYGGVDFNQDDLTPEDLHRACEHLRRDGVDGILATIITDHLDVMAARLRRIAELRQRDPLARDLIAGLHVEGPFINETVDRLAIEAAALGACVVHPLQDPAAVALLMKRVASSAEPSDVETATKRSCRQRNRLGHRGAPLREGIEYAR